MTSLGLMIVANVAMFSALGSIVCLWICFECFPRKSIAFRARKWRRREDDKRVGFGLLARWFGVFFTVNAFVFYFWSTKF